MRPVRIGLRDEPRDRPAAVAFVSPAQELEFGRQGYAPVISECGLYPDAALQSHVNDLDLTTNVAAGALLKYVVRSTP